MTPEERWWSRVDETEGCWRWLGAHLPSGYGKLGGRYAHRISYEMHVGPIPEGLEIDHLCGVRDCVNPIHLEAVTHRENVLRGRTIVAEAAAKTHCPQGHLYDEENTYVWRGNRRCRECGRASCRRAYLNRKLRNVVD